MEGGIKIQDQGLRHCCSLTPKTGFRTSRPILYNDTDLIIINDKAP